MLAGEPEPFVLFALLEVLGLEEGDVPYDMDVRLAGLEEYAPHWAAAYCALVLSHSGPADVRGVPATIGGRVYCPPPPPLLGMPPPRATSSSALCEGSQRWLTPEAEE